MNLFKSKREKQQAKQVFDRLSALNFSMDKKQSRQIQEQTLVHTERSGKISDEKLSLINKRLTELEINQQVLSDGKSSRLLKEIMDIVTNVAITKIDETTLQIEDLDTQAYMIKEELVKYRSEGNKLLDKYRTLVELDKKDEAFDVRRLIETIKNKIDGAEKRRRLIYEQFILVENAKDIDRYSEISQIVNKYTNIETDQLIQAEVDFKDKVDDVIGKNEQIKQARQATKSTEVKGTVSLDETEELSKIDDSFKF